MFQKRNKITLLLILTKEKSINAGPIHGTGEGVAHSKRWYVALVRMHHEKKVSERLSKMGIDSFVPVQQQIHQWSDRRKLVDTVLLPMMVFVHVTPKERMEVLSFSTVSRYMVMRGESTPAVIPDEQVHRFGRQRRVASHQHVENGLRADDLRRRSNEWGVTKVLANLGVLLQHFVHAVEGFLLTQLPFQVRQHASRNRGLENARICADKGALELGVLGTHDIAEVR